MTAIQNQTLAAIGFASLNAMFLAGMGLFAKLLGDILNPFELVFTRSSLSLILIIAGFFVIRQTITIKTNRPWAHLLRSTLGTAGILMGMWSFTIMSVTQATVLFFTQPLFVTLLSAILLREKIGLIRSLAVLTGFAGVFIATGPSNEFTLFQLGVGIGYAFLAATVDICLRWLGNTEKTSTTVFYFLIFSLIITGFYMPFSEVTLTIPPWLFALFAIGLSIGNLGSLLAKTQSFRLAEASLITPITYTMIIWAGLFDYFIWHQLPGISLLIGAAIIITSNIVIIHQEHKKPT